MNKIELLKQERDGLDVKNLIGEYARTGWESIPEADVQRSLDGRLAKFKQPKRVFFVDDLPRNTMGKVQKNKIRERYGAVFSKD